MRARLGEKMFVGIKTNGSEMVTTASFSGFGKTEKIGARNKGGNLMRIPQGNKWSWKRNRTKMAILKKSMERNDDYSTTPIKILTNTTE